MKVAATGPGMADVLLRRARAALEDARRADTPGERFCLAHLAALRTAAAVVAERARPSASRRRLVSVWELIERLAPEYDEWARLFSALAPVRAALEAGASGVVGARQADDQARAAEQFLALVEAGRAGAAHYCCQRAREPA